MTTLMLIMAFQHFFTLVTDNAAANNALFRTAARYLLSLYNIPEHPDRHIRCLAHVINLVVQAILAALDKADVCDDVGGDGDYFRLNKDGPIHYDVNCDPDQAELEAMRDEDMEERDVLDEEYIERLADLGFDEAEDEIENIRRSALQKVSSNNTPQQLHLTPAAFSFASSPPRSSLPRNAANATGRSQLRSMPTLCSGSSWWCVMFVRAGTRPTP
jgi:hypothetical protein